MYVGSAHPSTAPREPRVAPRSSSRLLVVKDEQIEVGHRRDGLHDLGQADEPAPAGGHGALWATTSDLMEPPPLPGPRPPGRSR